MQSLFSEIKEDWVAHGKDWTLPGFRAIAIYRFGVWRMGVKPRLLRGFFSVIYRALFRRARNLYGIEIPYTARIGRHVIFEHQHGIVIHGSAEVGEGCYIRQGVTIGNRYLHAPQEAPRIGKRVNIGAGAQILGAVCIGDDVNIGANAVVLSDVESNSTVVGIPARPLSVSPN